MHLTKIYTAIQNGEITENSAITDSNYFFQYGCYCFPENRDSAFPRNKYAGPALDELDQLCRNLFRATKCLNLEFQANGWSETYGECDATTEAYPFYFDSTSGDPICGNPSRPQWATREKNACLLATCNLEAEFVIAVTNLIKSGFVRNQDYISVSNSDYDSICLPEAGTKPKGQFDQCCGTGLDSKPFNVLTRECCDGKIHDLGSC